MRVRPAVALLLFACGPALAPLPPPAPLPPQATAAALAHEAQMAFGPDLPPDARLIRLPAWATLQSVWGTYDPPLVDGYREIVQVAFRPDGHTLVLLDRRGQLWLWDREARAIRGRIDACVEPEQTDPARDPEPAQVLATSPDGMAAVGFQSHVCVADLSAGNVTAKVDVHSIGGLMSLRLASGKLVTYRYTSSAWYPTQIGSVGHPEYGGHLRSWDARSGAELSNAAPGGAWMAAISPDGERFAMIPQREETILDEVRMLSRTGQVLWVRKLPAKTPVHRMVFATNDVLLATDGDRIFSMSARDGALLGFFEERDPPLPRPFYPDYNPNLHADIALTPDGRHAITNTASWVTLWDVGARREVARASRESQDVLRSVNLRDLAPSPDGSMFATTSMELLSTTALEIVDAPGGPLGVMSASGDARRAIAARTFHGKGTWDTWDAAARTLRRSPGLPWQTLSYGGSYATLPVDGARAAILASDFIELREWSSARQLWITPRVGKSEEAIFSPDGGAIATLRWNHDPDRTSPALATLLDAATGAVVWQRGLEGPRPHALFFGRDGRTTVFFDGDNRLVVLDARDGSVLRSVGPTEEGTWTLAGDTRALVVGPAQRSIASYDLETGGIVWRTNEGRASREGSTFLVASPAGRTFYEAQDSQIRRRSADSGADLGDPIDLGPSADAPRQLAVSSDGRTLLVGTRRGVLVRFGLTR